MRAIVAGVLLLATTAAAETVRFRTADGVEIVADFHRGGDDAPTVVCLPMYGRTRETYGPVVGPLLAKKINVLVLDLRGHGDSAPELKERVAAREPAVFQAMHADVEAALAFLEREKGCDPTRIGLVGASVGCSVAVDATVRLPEAVRAVVLLTPGARYLGVPTLEHLRSWPGTRVFVFSSFEEEATTKPVVDVLNPHDGTNYMFFDEKGIHGTGMFGKVPGIEELIANFMESSLFGKVDLRVPQWKKGDPASGRPVLRPSRRVGDVTYGFTLYAVGDTLTLGAVVDLVHGSFSGSVRFHVNGEQVEVPFDTRTTPANGYSKQTDGCHGLWSTTITRDGAGSQPVVALEFVPAEGPAVRIPGGGAAFAVIPQPVRRP